MRKNGFTLIELLAVIVILAIIALIATPIILGIINDAREESNERSVELYAAAVKNGIAAYQLTGLNAPKSFSDLTIQYDGDVKCTVQELYEDGSFYLGGCKVNNGEKEYSYGTKQGSDVVKLCTANTTKATALVYQDGNPMSMSSYGWEEVGLLASDGDAYAKGVAYTCNFGETDDSKNLTFFVLSSTENEVTLISGSNLGSPVTWCASGKNNSCYADGAKAALVDRTSNWSIKKSGKLNDTQMSTIMLPTKNQIEGAYEGTIPKWLKGHTQTQQSVIMGYWTNTFNSNSSSFAWGLDIYLGVVDIDVDNGVYYGVRPVITLLKSQI